MDSSNEYIKAVKKEIEDIASIPASLSMKNKKLIFGIAAAFIAGVIYYRLANPHGHKYYKGWVNER